MSAPDAGGQRPADSRADRRVLLVDLDGRLTMPIVELEGGETVREACQRILGPHGFQVHLVHGVSRRDRS